MVKTNTNAIVDDKQLENKIKEVSPEELPSLTGNADKVLKVKSDASGVEWGEIQSGMEVVELTSAGGYLTDEDFAKVSGNNCIIKYGNLLFNKEEESSSELLYENYDTSSSKLVITYYEIDKNNKYYNRGTREYPKVSEYTPSTSDVSLKGLNIGGSVYKIGESVVAYEGTSLLPTDVSFTDWSLHRAIKDGNILWLVVISSIKNNSASSQSISDIVSLTLPSNITNKIYRRDGTTCNNSYSSNSIVTSTIGLWGSSVTTKYLFNCAVANTITISLTNASSLAASESKEIEIRFPIFLDIGA